MCTIWESLHEGLTYRASLSLVLVRVKSMEEMEGGEVLCPLHLQKNAQDLDDQDQQTSRCVCPACQAGLSEVPCIKKVTVHQSGFDTLDQVHIIGHLT